MENEDILIETLDGLSGYLKFLSSIGYKGFDSDKETIELIKSLDSVSFKIECPPKEQSGNDKCPDCYIPYNLKQGFGSRNSELVFICDTPDDLFHKDSKGYLLFEKMLKAINISIEDVYITSLIKCPVPDYILPSSFEYDRCYKHLKAEIDAISPRIICILGSNATRVMLKKEGPVSDLRGHFIEFGRSTVFPTFHPSFLMGNPEYKKTAWNDLQLLRKKLDEI